MQHFCECIATFVLVLCAIRGLALRAVHGSPLSQIRMDQFETERMMRECEVVWWRLMRDLEIASREHRRYLEAQPARQYAQIATATSNQNAPDIRIARRNVYGHGHFRSRLRPFLTDFSGVCAPASAGCSSGAAAGSDQRGRWVIMV